MRSGVLLCIAAFACVGCYDDAPGLRVVIRDPGLGADKVELFVATRSAMTSSVGADVSRPGERRDKLRGDTYFLDGPADGTTPMTVLDIVDGQVVWNLQDPDGPSSLALVVAVAYDGQGRVVGIAKMRDVDVPANDAVAYILRLEEAKQIAPSDLPDPPGIRVWPWRKANAPTTAACLGIEHSDGSGHLERMWLVPEDDPDCDEAEIECDKFLYRADYSQAASTCIVPAVVAGSSQIPCKLGQKVCMDGVSAGECTPRAAPTYCLANALCDPEECLTDTSACKSVDSSKIECEIATEGDGAVCDTASVGGGPLPVALSNGSALFPGGCQAVQFAAPDPSGFISVPTVSVGGVTFSIDGLSTTQCSFSIQPSGQFDLIAANGAPLLLVLDVTRNGAHYLVPIFLKLSQGACGDRAPMCNAARGTDLAVCQ